MHEQWVADPAGRAKYRWWDGQAFTAYTSDDTKTVAVDSAGLHRITKYPVTDRPAVKPTGRSQLRGATSATEQTSYDSAGELLGVAGWILLGLSVLVGGVVATVGASDSGGTALPGIALGFIGALQSLVLVGFGRLVQTSQLSAFHLEQATARLDQSTALQQRTVELLERAVNQSDQP